VGLRSPSHPVARALLAAFTRLGGRGVAAPSANRFGRLSPTRAEHVADDLGDEFGLILDGGPCEVGVESTIVDLSRDAPVLLRPGGIGAQRIAEVLGVAPGGRDAQAPRASGTLAAHYAPRTALELVDSASLAARLAELAGQGMRVGVWSRERPAPVAAAQQAPDWVPAPADPAGYARELYDTLRRLDGLGLHRLLVERVPQQAAWDAVRDRLARAAASFEE
jgi:L-threonylcarbamoyladenylate synthase